MLEDDTNIELRSNEFQDVLEAIPLWICRWGITILAIIIVVFTIGSAVYKYPDILTTNFVLTTTNPSTDIMAMSSGKIKEIYVENEQDVTFKEYLAVIENSATTKDMIYLKEYLQHFDLKSDSLELVYPSKINMIIRMMSVYKFYT
jgi:HlyD family secretion protein